MDVYESAEPAADLKYVDVLSEFEDHDVGDAVSIYSIPVSHLAPLGHLGRYRAAALLKFTRDKILGPLGLLDTGHQLHHQVRKDSVEVISVGDSSVELVMKTEDDSVELVMKTEDDSVELVVKPEDDSVELVMKTEDSSGKLVARSIAESEMSEFLSENNCAVSTELTQERRDAILQWQESMGGEDSGASENEDATVLYSSDVDDVARWLVSSHEL